MSTLTIRSLELHVKLGWLEKERLEEQVVLLDIAIWFQQPPQACESDDLKDTVCYANLIEHLRASITKKHFHLLEYLSRDIYSIIKAYLSPSEKVNVRLTKRPLIDGLLNGVTFDYGDSQVSW